MLPLCQSDSQNNPRIRIKKISARYRLESRILLRLLLLLACFFSSPEVTAGQFSALINGKAIHMNTDKNKNYNEENWGAGVQYDYGNVEDKWIPFAAASWFLDSSKNPSYYAGGGYARRFMLSEKMDKLHIDIGVVAFLMSRRDYRDGDLFPGALPMLSIGTQTVSINITYIPEVAPKMVELWFFQLKLRLLEF